MDEVSKKRLRMEYCLLQSPQRSLPFFLDLSFKIITANLDMEFHSLPDLLFSVDSAAGIFRRSASPHLRDHSLTLHGNQVPEIIGPVILLLESRISISIQIITCVCSHATSHLNTPTSSHKQPSPTNPPKDQNGTRRRPPKNKPLHNNPQQSWRGNLLPENR